jgi:hypothetical protein
MTRDDEAKVRSIIKSILDKEFKSLEQTNKKFLTKEDLKELLAKAFMKQHKFMWEKSKMFTTYLKDL